MTDGDIVLRPTNRNVSKRGPCTLFFRLTLFQLHYLVKVHVVKNYNFLLNCLFTDLRCISTAAHTECKLILLEA